MPYEAFKAARADYDASAFYYYETRQEEGRFVAWAPNPKVLFRLMKAMIQNFTDDLELLFKKSDDEDEWNRFYGETTGKKLLAVMKRHQHFILHDGSIQLCVRRPDTHEYFAFDEHGVLYFYSKDQSQSRLFEAEGLKNERVPLINSQPHWCVTLSNSEESFGKLVKELGMEPTK